MTSIRYTISGMHCEMCGDTEFETDSDGYTECCNELSCSGSPPLYPWGNRTDYVMACCSAAIPEEVFKRIYEQGGFHRID